MKLKSLKNAEHRNSSHLELDATDEEAAQGEKKGCWVWVWVVGISWRATHPLLYWGSTTNTNEECGGSMKMLWVCSKSSDISLSHLRRGLGLWIVDCGCQYGIVDGGCHPGVHLSGYLCTQNLDSTTMHCWLRAIATNIAWENICSYQHSLIKGLITT